MPSTWWLGWWRRAIPSGRRCARPRICSVWAPLRPFVSGFGRYPSTARAALSSYVPTPRSSGSCVRRTPNSNGPTGYSRRRQLFSRPKSTGHTDNCGLHRHSPGKPGGCRWSCLGCRLDVHGALRARYAHRPVHVLRPCHSGAVCPNTVRCTCHRCHSHAPDAATARTGSRFAEDLDYVAQQRYRGSSMYRRTTNAGNEVARCAQKESGSAPPSPIRPTRGPRIW